MMASYVPVHMEDGSFPPRMQSSQRPPVKVLRQVSRAAGTNVPSTLVRRSSLTSETSRTSITDRVPTPIPADIVPAPQPQEETTSSGIWRGSTGRQKGILLMLALTDIAIYMALSILAPFFPQEASKKGVSEFLSGWIFGIFSLVQCITSPLFGKLLPKLGARWTLLAGMFFCGGCTILFGFLQYIPGTEGDNTLFITYCFLLRAFMAIGASANATAGFAIAAATFSDNPATVLGLLETAVGLGLMLGPALGGVLYEVGGFVTPFAVLGTIMVLTVPICLCVLPPENQDEQEDSSSGSIKTLLKIPAISVTGVAVFICSLSWVVLDPTLEPHLRPYGLSPSIIGLIFLLESACYAVCSPVWGWVADNVRDSAPMMITGLLLSTVAFSLLGPSPLIELITGTSFRALWLDILALIVLGFASSLAIVPTYDKILDAAEQAGIEESMGNYSAVAGLWNGSYSFGEFVGPVLAGWLVSQIGFPYAMTLVSILCLIMAIVMFVQYLYEKRYGPYILKLPKLNVQGEPDETSPLLDGDTANGHLH